MKVKLNMQQRQERQVSAATAKLFVRDTNDEAMPDIDSQFTTSRSNDPNLAVNLDNLGAGRRGGGDKDGAPAVSIGGSRRGSHDGTATKVNVSIGSGSGRGTKGVTGAKGEWVRVTNPGAIAQYQVKCLNNDGVHIYGNTKIQCQNNGIVAVWRRM